MTPTQAEIEDMAKRLRDFHVTHNDIAEAAAMLEALGKDNEQLEKALRDICNEVEAGIDPLDGRNPKPNSYQRARAALSAPEAQQGGMDWSKPLGLAIGHKSPTPTPREQELEKALEHIRDVAKLRGKHWDVARVCDDYDHIAEHATRALLAGSKP